MRVIGIVTEFDPLHKGHEYLIRECRNRFGEDTAIVAAMSGSYTQRGEAAICMPQARAEMAVHAGADLVIEIPVPFATASAEDFARGGIEVLKGCGVVDTLCFGSETADEQYIKKAAECLESELFQKNIREEMKKGVAYASARAAALHSCMGDVECSGANDLLGMEYLRFWKGDFAAIRRNDCGHNGAQSASEIRKKILAGDWSGAYEMLPEYSRIVLERERDAGRCPASLKPVDRAMLYRLRSMSEEDFARITDCNEGLENRLVAAARDATNMEDFYLSAKSKRYAHARIRRIALRAFLGMDTIPDRVSYLRVLGISEQGAKLLRKMKKDCGLPVVTKSAHGKNLDGEAGMHFIHDRNAEELWGLCLDTPISAGFCWRADPFIALKNKTKDE